MCDALSLFCSSRLKSGTQCCVFVVTGPVVKLILCARMVQTNTHFHWLINIGFCCHLLKHLLRLAQLRSRYATSLLEKWIEIRMLMITFKCSRIMQYKHPMIQVFFSGDSALCVCEMRDVELLFGR